MKTLEVFDKSVDWLLKNEFTNEDIDEAKLAVFQQVSGSKSLILYPDMKVFPAV